MDQRIENKIDREPDTGHTKARWNRFWDWFLRGGTLTGIPSGEPVKLQPAILNRRKLEGRGAPRNALRDRRMMDAARNGQSTGAAEPAALVTPSMSEPVAETIEATQEPAASTISAMAAAMKTEPSVPTIRQKHEEVVNFNRGHPDASQEGGQAMPEDDVEDPEDVLAGRPDLYPVPGKKGRTKRSQEAEYDPKTDEKTKETTTTVYKDGSKKRVTTTYKKGKRVSEETEVYDKKGVKRRHTTDSYDPKTGKKNGSSTVHRDGDGVVNAKEFEQYDKKGRKKNHRFGFPVPLDDGTITDGTYYDYDKKGRLIRKRHIRETDKGGVETTQEYDPETGKPKGEPKVEPYTDYPIG